MTYKRTLRNLIWAGFGIGTSASVAVAAQTAALAAPSVLTTVDLAKPNQAIDSARVDASAELTQLLGGWQTLATNFSQVVSNEHGRVIDRSSGHFILKRPSSFSWQVQQPFEQLILGVGETLWSYEKELEQLTIQTTEGSLGEVPAFLLTKDSDIGRSFKVSSYSFKEPKSGLMQQVFELIPKNPENSLEQVVMTFQGRELLGMELADAMGQRTRVAFSATKVNPTVDDAIFKFTPPKGVDVIDNRKSAARP